MRRVNANAVIARLLQFMSTYLTAQEVTVLQALDDDLPEMLLDRSQIEQVIKNVVINATQAMPHGGYLTVSSRFFAASEIIELSFSDTGVGIPPEKMEKIWTPFFTTKTKGTGLGLAIARKIVETHGGKLTVRSIPGEGSTFTIHLPLNPLEPGLVSPSRMEITEQRSEQAGEIYEMPLAYAIEN
jgi:signal transduction histidine kinase